MDTLDFGRLQDSLNLVTARQVSLFSEQEENHRRVVEEISREAAHRNAKIVAGAEASVAQKELLEEQLKEIKEQNSQLKDNYRLLNELYESAKRDAVESAKEARHNKIFGWVSFGVGTLIGIAGIVFGIIF